jgi:hypothetical protein
VTTAEYMGVYAFDGDGVRRAGTFGYDGQEAVVREGFTCHPPATIVQHVFEADTPLTRHTWRPTTTTYRWVGATLRRAGTRHGGSAPLPRREVGAHC